MAVIKGKGQSADTRGNAAHRDSASRARITGDGMPRAEEQGLLFGEEPPGSLEEVGYRGPTACTAAGITYRQLDYWARTGLVEPSVRPASGSGSQRLYGFRDILALKIVKRLLDTGISLQQIRTAVAYLREQGASDVAQVTLMSDGASVYACTSPDEVVDLLQRDPGVQQAFHDPEGQDVPEAVQPLRTGTGRGAHARLHQPGPGPVVQLAVADPGGGAGRRAAIADIGGQRI